MGQLVYASLTCEIHLFKGLRANLSIGNDIMSPEGFIIDDKKKSVFLRSCGVTIPIDARQKGQFLIRRLLASQEIVVPPRSKPLPSCISTHENSKKVPKPDKFKFLYHINKLTNIYHLCIPLSIALDILALTHEEGHSGFSRYYKIIMCSWFIRGLTKLLRSFICYCLQCMALQTRRYSSYGSLQPIKTPLVSFFTLTLDFVLALPLSKEKFNAIILVTCKFLK